MIIRNSILGSLIALIAMSTFISCQEEEILVNSNDISYIFFAKDMQKDTTKVCFEFYPMEEGMQVKEAEISLDVIMSGKLQEKDLDFTVSVDEKLSTFSSSQCILPEKCTINRGEQKGLVTIRLKNSPDLKTEKKLLALKVNAEGEVKEGIKRYSRALLLITDQLVKPDWWSYKDQNNGTASSVDRYYLGEYSEVKYRLLIDVLRDNDDLLFDGQDKAKLRKYSLQVKYKVEEENEKRGPGNPLRDEFGKTIEIPVVG